MSSSASASSSSSSVAAAEPDAATYQPEIELVDKTLEWLGKLSDKELPEGIDAATMRTLGQS